MKRTHQCVLFFIQNKMLQDLSAEQKRIEQILETADLLGFTTLLSWWPLKRYVVAFTHNANVSSDVLAVQYWFHSQFYDIITLWWRLNSQTDIAYIDIGTSTDSLEEAQRLQKQYNQMCIRDRQENCEVR